jgi:hypothetical protein
VRILLFEMHPGIVLEWRFNSRTVNSHRLYLLEIQKVDVTKGAKNFSPVLKKNKFKEKLKNK